MKTFMSPDPPILDVPTLALRGRTLWVRVPRVRLKTVEICTWNVAPRWRSEIRRSPSGVVIVSPYLTSATADSVIAAADAASAEVYTRFETELFVNGGSSIATIKRLLLAGYRLFHVSGLHAKMVLAGSFASIGSQNLTRGGTTNRELSVLLRSERDVSSARRALESLREGRVPISLQMVEQVEAVLPKLRRRASALLREARSIDEAVAEEQQRREADIRRDDEERRRRVRQRAERLSELRSAIRRTPKARAFIDVGLLERPRPDTSFLGPYWTFKHLRTDTDLLRWIVDKREVHLEKSNRYLLIFEDTGRLLWPKVNHTQISKFGTALHDAGESQDGAPFVFGGLKYRVDFELAEVPAGSNLRITMTPPGRSSLAVVAEAWFSLDSLRFTAPLEPKYNAEEDRAACRALAEAMEHAPGELEELVRQRLLAPFVYKKNRTGEHAHEVFEGHGTRFRIRLHLVEKQPVLIATRLG